VFQRICSVWILPFADGVEEEHGFTFVAEGGERRSGAAETGRQCMGSCKEVPGLDRLRATGPSKAKSSAR
jgi:hypothetical protein